MNETVGQYRVISLLGEGGMGAVYEAEDTLLDIKVALKSLKTDLTKQPDLVERFREEAKIQVKLNNPHIVKLYTFMRDGDHYYMVMEYVEGRTLGTLLERVGRFRYRDAIHLMLQALDGLEHAHRMGVIHRDIKLNNIMVTPDGTVKVMDFGIARVLGSRRLTRAGNIVGTLDYISPEALNGLEITPAADIYSCGVMLYKMVTGSLPFISENDFLLARMHVEVPPPPPTLHVPDLPKRFEELILKALAKAPANRFQTAGQMADALEQFLDNDDSSQRAGSGSNASFWPRTPPPRSSSGSRGSGSDSGAGQQQQFRPPASSVAAAATANRRIEELMEQNRMREAMDLVQKSMRDFPDDTTLRDLRARIEREQRHYEADLRRSEQEIRGYLKRGLAEMALSAAEASLSRYSSEASLLELLEEAKQQVNEKQAKAKVADQLQEEIRPLLDEGRFGEAVAMVVEAISQHPDQPELSALLGRTIKAQKDSEKRKLIVECRKEAEKLKQEGQFDLAVARVEQTRLTHPDDPSLLTLLQQLLEARDEARRKSDLERVTRKVDELESAGKFEDAESALDIALRRFPRNRELIARREDIIAKIAAQRRAVDLESARKNVNFLKASGEWQDALAEIEAAIRRMGPDPLFDKLRKEVESSRKSYENQMDAAADRVRALVRSEKFAEAIDALKSLTKDYPNEPVFERLVADAGQGLEAQRKKARLTMLLQNALDLVESDKPESAVQLLADSASEFHNDPELARGLQHAREAQAEKTRRLALQEASQKADRAARTEDWTTAVNVLRAVLKQYPGDAQIEDKLADFEVREAAKIRIDTRRRAEETCKREVSNLIEQRQWTQAVSKIAGVLRQFPESEELQLLQSDVADRFAKWREEQERDDEAARIRHLIDSGSYEEAAERIPVARQRFAKSSIFNELATHLEQARKEAVNRQARAAAADRAMGLIASHHWTEAEELLSVTERNHGRDERIANARSTLEAKHSAYQSKLLQTTNEVTRLSRAEKWKEALAAAEKLRNEYPESPQTRALFDRTTAEFNQWRNAKELDAALEKILGHLDAERWDEADTALQSATQRFPESRATLGPLQQRLHDGRAEANRRRIVAVAVDQAKVLASHRQWTEALAELDRAEAETGGIGDPALKSARKSILSARKEQQEAVASACARAQSLMAAGKFEESLRELSKPLLDGEAAVEKLREQVRQAKSEAERRRLLADTLAGIRETIQAKNWPAALKRIESAEKQFPEQKEFAAFRTAVEEGERKQKLDARVAAVLNDLSRYTDPLAAIDFLRNEIHAIGDDPRLRDALSKAEKIQADRERELARLIRETESLLDAGKTDEAVRFVAGLPDEWRQYPSIVDLEQKSRHAAAVTGAEKLIKAGRADDAISLIEGLSAEWREESVFTKLANEARALKQRQIEEARAKELSRLTSEGDALIKAGKPAEAIRYLEGLAPEWRQEPALAKLDTKARDARRKQLAEEHARELTRLVTEATKLVSAGKPDEAIASIEALSDEWRHEPAIVEVTAKAREASYQRALAEKLANAEAMVAAGKTDEAIRYFEALPSEWRQHPAMVDVEMKAREAAYQRALSSVLTEANALISAGKPAEALRFLEALPDEWRQQPALVELTAKAQQQTREAEIARLVKEASTLVAAGKPTDAVRFLEELTADWREHPVIQSAHKKALEAVAAGEKKARDQEVARLVKEASALVAAGKPGEAVGFLDDLATEWREHPVIQSAHKKAVEAVAAAEQKARDQEVARLVKEASALVAAGKPGQAVQFLDDLAAEWREHPVIQSAHKKAQDAVAAAEQKVRDQELARLRKEVNSLLSAGKAAEAAQFIEGLSEEWRTQPAIAELGRKASEAEQKQREERLARLVGEVRGVLAGGRPAEAVRLIEALAPSWREQPALLDVLNEAREAVIKAEREAFEKELQRLLDQAKASVLSGDPAAAIRFIEGLPAEWRAQSALADLLKQAREAAAVAEQRAREQEVARIRKEVNALLSSGKPAEALRQIEALPAGLREHSIVVELNRKAQEAVTLAEQQAREKELARLVKEAEALLTTNKPSEAVQYLAGLDQAWRSQPALVDLEQKARHQQRQAGIEQARRTFDDLMAQGATAQAKATAEQALQAFPDAPELIEADQAAAASLQLEDRIRQLLDSQFLDQAIEVSKQGEKFPAVAALAAEAKRTRDAIRKAAEAFEQSVRQAIRDLRFDAAHKILDTDGGRFASTGTLRAELQAAEAEQAKEDRLAGYRKRIDAAWESNDFQAADLEIQHAITSDPEEPEVLEWLSEHEKRFQALRRQQRLAAAVTQANSLSTQRRFKDALAELDRAEAEDSGSEELKSARKAIVKARKQHQDAVNAAAKAAQSHIHAGKWESAERELVNSDFDTESEIERLRERVRNGMAEIERKRQFDQARTQITGAIDQRNWPAASQSLESTRQQFPGFDKELDPLAKQIAEGQHEERRQSNIEAAVAEADRQNDPAKALHILEKAVTEYGSDPRFDEAIEQHQKIRADREKQLAEMVAQARALLQNNQPAEAIQYLSALPSPWSQHPTLVQLASEASTAQQLAETKKREEEIEGAARNAAEWLNEGGSATEAKNAAQQALQSFPGAAALLDIVRRADQALHFESRIHTLIEQGQFEEAEKTWLEGAEFPTVAVLGNEIENRRADHKRKSETFEAEVQLLIREGRLDEANRRLQAEPGLAAAFPALRAELDQAQLHRAAEQRLADYRQKIEQAWSTGNLAAADAEIQKAIKTDSGAAIVFNWLSEQERRTAAAEKQKKLDRLKSDCKRAMESNALDRAAELLDRITRDHPSDSTVVDLTLALQKQRELVTRATESLNQAEEHLARQEFDEALNALNQVPAGTNWAEPVAKLRQRIQTEKKQAGRGKKATPAQTPEVTIPLPLPPPPVEPVPAEAASKGKTYAIIGAVLVLALVGWFATRGGGGSELSVSPDTLNLEGPDARRVQVTSGTPGVDFVAEASEPWIRLQEASGKTPGSFTVQAVPGTLAPDTYKTSVKVYPKGKPSEAKQVRVDMKVTTKAVPRKVLDVAPRAISITYQVTQPLPGARRVAITGVPSDSVRARVSKGADWLSVAISPGAATVSFRLQGKPAGNYAGEIEFAVEGGNTIRVPVTLVINAFKL
jgi:serine/threonine protein kinase